MASPRGTIFKLLSHANHTVAWLFCFQYRKKYRFIKKILPVFTGQPGTNSAHLSLLFMQNLVRKT